MTGTSSNSAGKSAIPLVVAVSAATVSGPIDLGDIYANLTAQVFHTGTGTYSVQIEGSLDNSHFVILGSAITSDGITSITTAGAVRYVQGHVTAATNATVSVFLGVKQN